MNNTNQRLWEPSEAFKKNSHLYQFQQWLSTEKKMQFDDYQALWEWSTLHTADFWECIWQYFKVQSHTPYQQVLTGKEMPFFQWFEGATLNYAEHIFRKKNNERPALITLNESGHQETISWNTLEQKVLAFRTYLTQIGIKKGDCIAAYLPNTSDAIVAFLAVNSLGAIWSCCSPDFGANTVIERFKQIEPKLLIAANYYHYGGKKFQKAEDLASICEALPSLQEVILILEDQPLTQNINSKITYWEDVLSTPTKGPLTFTPVPFNHPIWILYSSGTTGKPKAITHSHGGVLLEHLKYIHLHNDVKEGENFFWFTTTGWMMWNFLQASLLAGATAILYDGSPGFPHLNILWELTAKLPIHHFGTSAPFLTTCMKKGVVPGEQYDLSSLRSIGSTGAPLPPDVFDWVYEKVSKDVWLASMSGGTDVCTAFVGSMPYAPVYKGKIQARALGCALKAYDEDGNEVMEELGEMVIEKPMPSMPIYFWNDPQMERYHESYFNTYAGIWRHGDWVELFEDGSLIIQGRSDATLNRQGIRIGTAEIYNIMDSIEGVQDSLVINYEKDGKDLMPLYIVLQEGYTLTEDLQIEIRQTLRREGSPRHVPDMIEVVPDIPYTLSGKKMEIPVKKLLLGKDVKLKKGTVRNPEALSYFEQQGKKVNISS
ncbi:acetoacetate--CoA ligase [Algivirga pacifica]|uniref:Acetoacetate--CoA ligase n=1 Tax=Algivirga pacifica TaxID=1162670 RepID=A0ABP9DDL8_9BACT